MARYYHFLHYLNIHKQITNIDYSANGETDYYAEGDIAKDQLKRYLPALNVKCTFGILPTDLYYSDDVQSNLYRCI
jgi:hypothetical protein